MNEIHKGSSKNETKESRINDSPKDYEQNFPKIRSSKNET